MFTEVISSAIAKICIYQSV